MTDDEQTTGHAPPITNDEPLSLKGSDTQPRACPNCGGIVSSRAKTCLLCGADLEAMLETPPEEPLAPVKPAFSFRNLLIQVGLTVVGLILLAGIVWGFMAVVQNAGRFSPTPTPTPEATATLTPIFVPSNTPTLPPSPTLNANATPVPPKEHTVKAGDTLLGLALDNDTTVEAIRALNNLDSDIIRVGQVILIPSSSPGQSSGGSPSQAGAIDCTQTHTIQAGETLLGIAQRYGKSLDVILQLNHIDEEDAVRIQIGQKLLIPCQATPTATGGPSPTPTPLAKYPAPPLLLPLDRAEFQGTEMSILLQWAATALLRSNEWYEVTIETVMGGDQEPVTVRTKTSSLRVPPELYPSDSDKPRLFKWSVRIVRQASEPSVYEEASQPGENRSFWWVQPPPTSTPTPGPA